MKWSKWPYWVRGGVIVSVIPSILSLLYLLIKGDFGNSFVDSLWQAYNYPGGIIVLFSWVFGLISETTLSEWEERVIAISL